EDAGGLIPEDVPLAGLTAGQLDTLAGSGRDVADVYRLSPLQGGMVFHSLLDPGSGVYTEQFAVEFTGRFAPDRFTAAWQHVIARHANLRVRIAWQGVPQPVQVVAAAATVPVAYRDWRSESDVDAVYEAYLAEDR